MLQFKRVVLTHLAAGLLVATALGGAAPARADEVGPRITEHAIPTQVSDPVIEVTRERSPGKHGVRFEIEPFAVAQGAAAVFELVALGEESRVVERCVALSSSRECWEGARRFEYGPGDRAMRLRIWSAHEVVARRNNPAVRVASN